MVQQFSFFQSTITTLQVFCAKLFEPWTVLKKNIWEAWSETLIWITNHLFVQIHIDTFLKVSEKITGLMSDYTHWFYNLNTTLNSGNRHIGNGYLHVAYFNMLHIFLEETQWWRVTKDFPHCTLELFWWICI